MQYLGSKSRIAKHLLPIILENAYDGQHYIEPFVGGANMIDKVNDFTDIKIKKIGLDVNNYLIELLDRIKRGYIPPSNVTKEDYYNVKKSYKENNGSYTNEHIAFVAFLCSFGGKWFNGYAANSKGDNYAARGVRVLLKQSKKIQDIDFVCCSYDEFNYPSNSIIYCDPPYKGTTKYKDNFDHDKFYDWCRKMKSDGHIVFVSEYNMPNDFECLKTIETKTILDRNSQKKRIEKLFKI